MSTTPKTPTAEDLLAVQTPQELEYKFPDGSVVKGKDEKELLEKAAKRYDDLQKHARQVEGENAQLRQAAPAPTATPSSPAVATPGFDSQKYWALMNENPQQATLYAVASAFGVDPSTYINTTVGAVQIAQSMSEQAIAAQFHAAVPGFPATEAAAEALAEKMEQMGVPQGGANLTNMLAAHALCLQEKKYELEGQPPAEPNSPNVPQPPPMLNQPAAAIAGNAPNLEEIANQMKPSDLRAAIEKLAGAQQ